MGANNGFYIRLFGSFRIEDNFKPVLIPLSGSTKRLLIFLLHSSGVPVRRDYLCSIIWPEASSEKSRSALNTAFWRVKNSLKLYDLIRFKSDNLHIWCEVTNDQKIDASNLQINAEAARIQMRDMGQITSTTRRALASSVSDCRGEYLEALNADWALIEREKLSRLLMGSIITLAKDAESRDCIPDAIAWTQNALTRDPYREHLHHFLMTLFIRSGQRVMALRQYRKIESLLRKELGVNPLPQTLQLRDIILSGHQTDIKGLASITPLETSIPKFSFS